MLLRAMEAMKPKAQTTILDSLPYGPGGVIHAGTQRAHDAFEGFIVRITVSWRRIQVG